jgi:hypothetical protein
MFANPLLCREFFLADDVLRSLPPIMSPACRRDPVRVPLSAVAAVCGVNKLTLYRMLWTGRVSDEMAELLTPLVCRYDAGKLRCRRNGRHGDGRTVGRSLNRMRSRPHPSDLRWMAVKQPWRLVLAARVTGSNMKEIFLTKHQRIISAS